METKQIQETIDRTYSGVARFLAKWLWAPAVANPKTALGITLAVLIVLGTRAWKIFIG